MCLQAGNVNSGAFDDLASATAVAHDHGAWVHVDGAFGLWAAASPATRHLTAGIEHADSWAVDGHKWLNVPYDSGYAFCAHPDAHAAAMSFTAAYLTGHGEAGVRAPSDYVPESSRRARGFATWAALRELGRTGVADLVDRCCALARRFADRLGAIDGVTIANDVVLNQVLVGFGDDERTDRVVDAGAAVGDVLDGRHHLARSPPDAHLGVELAHHRRRRRPVGRRHRRRLQGLGLTAVPSPPDQRVTSPPSAWTTEPGHEARGVRRQEQGGSHHLVGCGGAPHQRRPGHPLGRLGRRWPAPCRCRPCRAPGR